MDVLVLEDFAVQDGRSALRGPLPGGDVGEVVVVAQGLTLGGLALRAEVPATALVAVEGVDAHELGELDEVDALHRRESCGGHFRAESQTPEGEALRDDDNFAYVAAWEWTPEGQPPVLHKEDLEYEYVHLAQRSYK